MYIGSLVHAIQSYKVLHFSILQTNTRYTALYMWISLDLNQFIKNFHCKSTFTTTIIVTERRMVNIKIYKLFHGAKNMK